VKCEFPLEPGFEPATTNIYFFLNGAIEGSPDPADGYLTFVPSYADCDKVQEGWTLDVTTQPATIRICPSACSCAKDTQGMLSQVMGCPRNEWSG
jgi:hypothetical protein